VTSPVPVSHRLYPFALPLNYAASAAISCFQAFTHRFLPEMQALSGVEKLETPCKETISRQIQRESNNFSLWDMVIHPIPHCQRNFHSSAKTKHRLVVTA
jgi:hypothetical protein